MSEWHFCKIFLNLHQYICNIIIQCFKNNHFCFKGVLHDYLSLEITPLWANDNGIIKFFLRNLIRTGSIFFYRKFQITTFPLGSNMVPIRKSTYVVLKQSD